jgi:hypothetical protein
MQEGEKTYCALKYNTTFSTTFCDSGEGLLEIFTNNDHNLLTQCENTTLGSIFGPIYQGGDTDILQCEKLLLFSWKSSIQAKLNINKMATSGPTSISLCRGKAKMPHFPPNRVEYGDLGHGLADQSDGTNELVLTYSLE